MQNILDRAPNHIRSAEGLEHLFQAGEDSLGEAARKMQIEESEEI